MMRPLRLLWTVWNCLRIYPVRKLFLVVLFCRFSGSRITKFESCNIRLPICW